MSGPAPVAPRYFPLNGDDAEDARANMLYASGGSGRSARLVHGTSGTGATSACCALCCAPATRMTLQDRVTLSAFEKYRQYGRIPWKFICHTLLLAFSTAQILLWNIEDGSYYRATNRNWQYWFMYRPSTTSACDLYTYDQVIDSFNETITNYYDIDKLSVDSYRTHLSKQNKTEMQSTNAASYQSTTFSSEDASVSPSPGPADSNLLPSAPVLAYTYYLHPESLFDYRVLETEMSVGTTTYTINASDSGPFDVAVLGQDKVVANINRMKSATLTLQLDSFIFGTVYRSCLEWEVGVKWDFEDRGQVRQSVKSRVVGSCNNLSWKQALSYQLIWLNIPILLIAFLYFLL
eukprot:g2931.t1